MFYEMAYRHKKKKSPLYEQYRENTFETLKARHDNMKPIRLIVCSLVTMGFLELNDAMKSSYIDLYLKHNTVLQVFRY